MSGLQDVLYDALVERTSDYAWADETAAALVPVVQKVVAAALAESVKACADAARFAQPDGADPAPYIAASEAVRARIPT